ncbi:GNAT family N-acetyltransferase [Streptomyces pseudovenezuelae]|uniref:RimJ/RimL family protein N-acetyltransferase n=1 Tax=Streptomyces pseudovenezuelae TaxID=67350 RepID=A0ABT6M1Q9_9ACTN|nr:GNAT family protein [Streptomyces pseudovenezuelae]MDH6222486.1 RimJ/RimL family protein N-acetyltransferase [Streptomyces pseudovenezuelae]
MRLPGTFDTIPTLTGDGIRLRAPRQDDLAGLVRAFSDDRVRRFMPVPPDYTAAHAQSFIDTAPDMWRGQRAVFVLADEASDTFIGEAELLSVNELYQSAEIAFLLDAPARRLRTAVAGLRLVCRFGFEQLGLTRIEAFADFENSPVHYAGLRAGFRHEGTARGKLSGPDGQRRDAVVAAVLPEDLQSP